MKTSKKVIAIAKVCHQANKSFCEANDDFSQKDWEKAAEWQKESAIKGVDFKLKNPKAKESAQHDAWMKDKIDLGWKYGKVKDEKNKTHPCIVPFSKLPKFQQKKDILFQAIVEALK